MPWRLRGLAGSHAHAVGCRRRFRMSCGAQRVPPSRTSARYMPGLLGAWVRLRSGRVEHACAFLGVSPSNEQRVPRVVVRAQRCAMCSVPCAGCQWKRDPSPDCLPDSWRTGGRRPSVGRHRTRALVHTLPCLVWRLRSRPRRCMHAGRRVLSG